MSKTVKKAVIFCRDSSTNNQSKGVAKQQKLLQRYANKNKLKVAQVFKSFGSVNDRQNKERLAEMFSYMEKSDIHHLLCMSVDRLTRGGLSEVFGLMGWIEGNPKRKIHIVKPNLVIHTNSNATEKFLWNMQMVLAKYEFDLAYKRKNK